MIVCERGLEYFRARGRGLWLPRWPVRSVSVDFVSFKTGCLICTSSLYFLMLSSTLYLILSGWSVFFGLYGAARPSAGCGSHAIQTCS